MFASILGLVFYRFLVPFWTPWATIWRQMAGSGAQNPPNVANMGETNNRGPFLGGLLEPARFQDPPQTLPGAIFDGFEIDFCICLVIVGRVFETICEKIKQTQTRNARPRTNHELDKI